MAMNIDSNSEMCGTVMNKAVSEAPSSGRPAVITVESEIYELQLTQLQEQLITAMIENEQLRTELFQFKAGGKIDEMVRELEYEREKNKQLCEKLQQHTKKAFVVVQQPKVECQDATVAGSEPAKKSFLEKVGDYLVELYFDLLTDFTADTEDIPCGDQESDQLAVKQLKDNIKRFKNGITPVLQFLQNMWSLLRWKSPAVTVFAMTLKITLELHTVIVFLRRIQNEQIRKQGWHVNFDIFCTSCDTNGKDLVYPELALSDKFNLVLQVARQVQNILGQLADGLEKIKNLLMWQHWEASKRLFLTLCLAFLLSCSVSGVVLFRLFAMYMGIKMFIIEYMYNRFPRFKQRHDSVNRLWKQLPTDAVLLSNYKRSLADHTTRDVMYDKDCRNVDLSESDKTFCTTFTLPLSERPLHGWEGGWRVTLVDQDKPFIGAFSRSGRLYLTNSFLCLERYKTKSSKNIMIPLTNITRVQKAKPFTWLPGAGMSVEISVVGYDKPYVFGAIVNRDECFNRIVQHGARLRLPWSTEHVTPSEVVLTDEPSSTDGTSLAAGKEKSFRSSDCRDVDDYLLLTS